MFKMGNIVKKIIILVIILCICLAGYIFYTTPAPEVFVVNESPVVTSVNQEVQFVDLSQLYPDESYMTIKCVCEDEEIAEIVNKISVKGVKKGTTNIKCKAKGKLLAELEVIVK